MDWPFISSRTPEGEPNRCPLCGKDVILEPSQPFGDAPCPHCGHLLWFFNAVGESRIILPPESAERRRNFLRRFASLIGVTEVDFDDEESLTALARMANDLGADSLDVVELVMELEEELDLPPSG